MPGFMDTHNPIQGAQALDRSFQYKIDRRIPKLVRAKAQALGPGEWVTGPNWSGYQFAEKQRPTRQDLDRVAPDTLTVNMDAK